MNLYFDSDVFRDAPAGIYRYSKEIASCFFFDSDVDCKFVSGRGLGPVGFLPALHAIFSTDARFYEKYSNQNDRCEDYLNRKHRDKFRALQLNASETPKLSYRLRREAARLMYQLEKKSIEREEVRFHFEGSNPVLFGPSRSLSSFARANVKPFRVQVLHDLIPKIHPEYFSRSENFNRIFDSLDENQLIITVSNSTRLDLLRLSPHINPAKVYSVPISSSGHFYPIGDKQEIARVKAKYGIPQQSDYVFSLSTVEPRKNHLRLLQAWGSVYNKLRINKPVLVIGGRKGWGDNFLRELYGHAEQVESVVLTGFVDDADLPALYSGSVCSIYPSLYEGFGIPVLESMKCARFCITSDVSSIPEITGSNVPLIDPLSTESIADLLLRVVNDLTLRRSLEEVAYQRAQEFSWEKTYARTKALISDAVSGLDC